MKTGVMFCAMEDQEKNEDSDALKRIIGARVRELRGTSVSQEELAKELRLRGIKIEQAQIGHIEAGRRLPSVQVLIGLADYYATSVDYVVGRATNPSSLADIEDVFTHRFRHTFAINFLRNGGNVFELQRILGHEELDTVKVYLAIAQVDIATSQRTHSPADNWRL